MRKPILIFIAFCLLLMGVVVSADAGGRETDTGRWPYDTIPVALVDPDGRFVGISDQGNNGLLTVSVDYAHHEIHEGNHYVTMMTDSLGIGGTLQMLINTPSGTDRVHFLCIHSSTGEGSIDVYRSPTVSSLGTVVIPSNSDDSVGDNSGVEMHHTPTITNAGTLLPGWGDHFGAGQTKGGESREVSEVIFRPGTLYLINGVSLASSNRFTMKGVFYVDSGDAP